MKMEIFPKKLKENTSDNMRMLSDLQLVYVMVPRNSTQLLNINTTKFQVEREQLSLGDRRNFSRGGQTFGGAPKNL